jgi:ribosomal protein S3AE
MAQEKRKKKFFDVEIPILGKKTEIYAYEMKEVEDKTIKYDLTRLLRGKGTLLTLRIKLEKDKLIGYPKKLLILPYFIKRVIKKGTNYVEDSFITNSKENSLVIKPLLITRRKVPRSVRKNLRNKCKEELIEILKNKKTEDIFYSLLEGHLQKQLSQKLKKIYPLSFCDIRVIEVKNNQKQ